MRARPNLTRVKERSLTPPGHCLRGRGTLMDGHKRTIGLVREAAGIQLELPSGTCRTIPCTSPPSCGLPGTFAPQLGLIHRATPLRPGELKALFVCTP
ncbi:hypothetical protein Q5P01_017321 [Channa striata]|uniref:Uncharacterized protein n=1 Tax=Channa striata TaxID=64152 RepID=A0AA88MC48_CHASR|nr:hypothetical protein Q5P01_017321 [Channa striata]